MKPSVGAYYWVKLSKRRRIVIMAMKEDEMIPNEISTHTRKYGNRITLPNLNRILKELVAGEIVRCTDTTIIKGRPYSLTPKGKAFRERLNQSSYFEKDEEQHTP